MFYLYIYTVGVSKVREKYPDVSSRLIKNNLAGKVELLGYCLMPNHYHLLVREMESGSISRLMKQVVNGYTTYFNHKYRREGAVMQGRFKAIGLDQTIYYDMLRYIHFNPVMAGICSEPWEYEWSSYKEYAGENVNGGMELSKDWISKQFHTVQQYLEWHKDRVSYSRSLAGVREVTIDDK
jgi:putative transposase